jgi:predicted TIM-barrel fold metal-dependent hydrolase
MTSSDVSSRSSTDRCTVVSADTHAGASLFDYRSYLPAQWYDEFDRWAAAYRSPWANLDEAISKQEVERNWNHELRLKEIESQGIAGEVLFPNTTPPFFETIGTIAVLPRTREEYERRWVGVQAHNRWVVDFCSLTPGRRRGLAQIFPNDVDDAVAEIEYAAKTGHIGGILLSVVPPNTVEPLYHERYDPLWAAAARHGMPVCQHLGNGSPGYPMDQAGSGMIATYELNLWPHRMLWHLILGGVFERHPEVQFVMTEESPPRWFLNTLLALDSIVAMTKSGKNESQRALDPMNGAGRLSLTPTEYFRRNCYIGASFLAPDQVDDALAVGADRILWGADYPHEESTFPHTIESLRATFAKCDSGDRQKMIADNTANLFGFNRKALDEAAARIGPLYSDLDRPLLPADYPDPNAPAFRLGSGTGICY